MKRRYHARLLGISGHPYDKEKARPGSARSGREPSSACFSPTANSRQKQRAKIHAPTSGGETVLAGPPGCRFESLGTIGLLLEQWPQRLSRGVATALIMMRISAWKD